MSPLPVQRKYSWQDRQRVIAEMVRRINLITTSGTVKNGRGTIDFTQKNWTINTPE